MKLARLVPLVALGGGTVYLAASCSPFDAAPDVTPDTIDSGSPIDGATSADAGDGQVVIDGASSIDGGDCIDLTGPSGFASFASASGQAGLVKGATEITYPPSVAGSESVALWRLAVPVAPGMNAMTVTIDATIQLQGGLPISSWYAGFGGVVQGPVDKTDTASYVELGLANDTAGKASFDVNTFPLGSAAPAGPTTSNNFDGVIAGSAQSVRAVLDVRWSTDPALPNVVASLEGHTTRMVNTPTLSGALDSSWTILLGGSAASNPAITIDYTRVCTSQRKAL